MNKVTIALALVLIICTKTFAQNCNIDKHCGVYTFSSEVYIELELFKNGLFKFKYESSFKYPYYFGTWKVKKDFLILAPFISIKEKPSYTQNWCEVEDTSCSVFIYIHDNNYKPITCDSIKFWYGYNNEQWISHTRENIFVVESTDIKKSMYIKAPGYEGVDVKYKYNRGNCLHLFTPPDGKFPLNKTTFKIKDGVIILPSGAELQRVN